MKNVIFGALCFFLFTAGFPANAQETGTKFQVSDFKQLHQMVGNWKGMAAILPFLKAMKLRTIRSWRSDIFQMQA